METFTREKGALDPDAKELLECANNLDLRGACYMAPCDQTALARAHEAVIRHLEDLASLAEEIKDGGFKIYILNQGFNEKDLVPGSIQIMLSKNGETLTIYRQVFGLFFLQDFKDSYPDKESLRRMVAESKAETEKKLKRAA